MEQQSQKEQTQIQHKAETGSKNFYDKYYKIILIIPAILLLLSVLYLYNFNAKNRDIINKDVSLTGGTTISVYDSNIKIDEITAALQEKFPEISIRGISDIQTGKQIGVIIETKSSIDQIRLELEKILNYKLTSDNSSIEFTGSTISQGFYQQLRNTIFAAFLLMSCVVFITFSQSKFMKGIVLMLGGIGLRILLPNVSIFTFISIALIIAGLVYGLMSGKEKKKLHYYSILGLLILSLILFKFDYIIFIPLIFLALFYIYIRNSMPSFMVTVCAFADIVMTIAVVDLIGMKLSIAGIIAFLMLIGYSVDTDILMTSRLLKEKEGTVNKRIWDAFKTGIMMTLTSIAAVGISLLIIRNLSETLHQIFTIVLIGLGFDIFNTWVTNASLLKWYMEVKKLE